MRKAIVTAIFLILTQAGFQNSAKAQTFKGYPCTVDCSGHHAGYDWAQENNVTDESDCDGNSDSFNEGCQAWVQEQAGQESNDQEEDQEDTQEDQSGDETGE